MTHLSPSFYPKPAKFETKSQIAPNAIVFHVEMSDAAVRLLLALNGISSCAPNWTVVQIDLQKRLRWGREKMRNAIKECVTLGYMKVKQARSQINLVNENHKIKKGQYAQNEFEFDLEGSYLSETTEEPLEENPEALPVEASRPTPIKPSSVTSSTESRPLPMPKEPVPRVKALKGIAPLSSSSRALEASPSKKPIGKQDPEVRGRRHKRPEALEETFQWLLGLDLTNEKGLIDDEVLSVLAFKYTRKKLEDTYAHLIHKLEDPKLKIKKSLLAFFRHLLNNEHDCRGTNSDLNAAYARKFAKELAWGTLEIKDKYVIDRNNSAKDISLNMEPSSFRDCLGGLYMSLHGNFGT